MMTRRWWPAVSLVAIAAAILAAGPAWAAEDTTAKVSIESTSVAAGVGFGWGNGVLEYRGQEYAFRVTGFTILDVGVSKLVAQGEVYDLDNAEDFEGMFMAAVASASMGGGAGAAAMHNQHGVTMVWTATSQGVNFTLAQAGIKVTFTNEARARAAASRQSPSGETQPSAAPGASR